MAILEKRVDRLEEALTRFMATSERVIAEIRQDVEEIRASNARTDRQLKEMQQRSDRRFEVMQLGLKEMQERSDQRFEEMHKQADRDREKADKDRTDFNKRLAEVTDSQGLLIENMVWPNLPRIATQVFADKPLMFCAIRLKRNNTIQQGYMKEIDLLAASTDSVLVCEAKSKVTADKVREFLESLEDLTQYFPEYKGYKIYGMIASIAFESSVIRFMNAKEVLALGFGDNTMELINPEILR